MITIKTIPRWTMHDVKDWHQLYVANGDGINDLNLVTSTLINYTMIIGINEINEDNLDDVSCRIALVEAIIGTTLMKENKRLFITRGDVARHIGLRTEAVQMELANFWAEMRNYNRQNHSAGLREANDDRTALYSLYQLPTP